MPTWSDIQLWNSEALSSYAETLNSRKQTIDQQVATLENRQNSFQGEGQTADALRSAMGTAHAALRGISEQMEGVRNAITKAASSVQGVEKLVSAALSAASARHCYITDTGTVGAYRPYQTDLPDKSSEVVPLVRRALAEAEKVDDAFYALLTTTGLNVSSAKYSNKGVHALTAAEQETFKNMPTEERAKYWSQQSPEQKRYLCDTYPDLIGNADGVEAWARDRANRLRLPKLKQAAQNELDSVNKELNAGRANAIRTRALEARKEELEAQVASYKEIERQLNDKGRIRLEDYQHGAKGEPFSLLTLQVDDGRVVAAVARGDVDHAKNVATIVPGISTTVNGKLGGEISRAGVIRDAAVAEGNLATKDVAVVSWLGYKAPPGLSLDMEGNLDIATPDLARKGAVKLAGFETGLAASRRYGAGDANITLIGHSYGSVVSGMATTMTHDGDVDNVILCGSPGMGTDDPSEIHVPRDHRFVSGIPTGDFVQGAGEDKGVPAAAVLMPIVGSVLEIGHLGMNPMDHESGFTHISGDATGCKDYDAWAGPSSIDPETTNHSNYICRGTEISRDMGRIVAGGYPRAYPRGLYDDYPLTKPTRPIA